MTAKTISLPSLPTGLTLSVKVRNPLTLALLETVALTEGSGDAVSVYTGTMTGAHAGQLLFEIIVSGVVFEKRLRTITDTAATFIILTELEERANDGRGAHLVTITVTDEADNPLENAQVRLTSGILGGTRATNPSGVAQFSLNSATYDVTITCPGYAGTVTTLVVAGVTPVTYELASTVVSLPEDPGLATGILIVLNEDAEPEADVEVNIQLTSGPGVAGFALDTKVRTETSVETGQVEFTRLIHGATYAVWSGSETPENTTPYSVRSRSTRKVFTVPVAESFNIAEFLRLDAEV